VVVAAEIEEPGGEYVRTAAWWGAPSTVGLPLRYRRGRPCVKMMRHPFRVYAQSGFLVTTRCARCFSVVAPPAPPPPWVARANEALRLQPAACLLGLLVAEGAALTSLTVLFRVLALPVPLDVVGAVALSRALRRARVPLNLAAAALLARAYPPLTMVRFPQMELSGSRLAARVAPPGSRQARALALLDGAVAGYGPAYVVAARCVMAPLSIAACIAAIRSDTAAPLLAAAREHVAWLLPAAADAVAGGDALAAGAAASAGHAALALIATSPMFPLFAMAGITVGRLVERSRRARGGAPR
jgi:hypothetical protein